MSEDELPVIGWGFSNDCFRSAGFCEDRFRENGAGNLNSEPACCCAIFAWKLLCMLLGFYACGLLPDIFSIELGAIVV